MTRNQIAYWDTREKERAAKAQEQEQHRSNLVNEQELARSHQANEANQARLAQIQALNLEEVQRSNRAKEQETNRANIAREFETNRNNLAKEDLEQQLRNIQQFTASIDAYKASILSREADIAATKVAEEIRANKQRELLQSDQLEESIRHNKASESNEALRNLYNRLNKLTDKEIADMNLSQTQIRDINNLKLGLYGVLNSAAETQNSVNRTQVELIKGLNGIPQNYSNLIK